MLAMKNRNWRYRKSNYGLKTEQVHTFGEQMNKMTGRNMNKTKTKVHGQA